MPDPEILEDAKIPEDDATEDEESEFEDGDEGDEAEAA